MIVVGLTGGIGSGKSTLAELFAERGVPVIDTDIIARELVAPGQPCLTEITEVFGGHLLGPDGALDREGMRREVFSEPDRRRRLEAILHPRIRTELQRRIAALPDGLPYCVVVIPLLVEAGWQDLVDRVLVVDVPPEQQVARTARRDGVTERQVEAILAAQADREERLAAADDVVHNSGDTEALRRQMTDLDRRYRELAAGGGGDKASR